MRQAKINKERAERAARALKALNYWDCGESYGLADFISDARHLCDREGWTFDDVLETAAMHYESERRPDDIESDARRMHRKGEYAILKD